MFRLTGSFFGILGSSTKLQKSVSAGFGSIFGAIFFYSAFVGLYDFVSVYSKINPIYVFTHPMFVLIIAFLSYFLGFHKVSKFFHVTFLIQLMPLFSALILSAFVNVIYYIMPFAIDNLTTVDFFNGFHEMLYGDYAKYFNYYEIGDSIMNKGRYHTFIWLSNLYIGVIMLIAYLSMDSEIDTFVNLFTRRKKGLDKPSFNFDILTPFAYGLLMIFIYPMMLIADTIPLEWVRISVVWLLFIFPLIGFRTAITNILDEKGRKRLKPLILLYIFIFLGLFSFVGLYDPKSIFLLSSLFEFNYSGEIMSFTYSIFSIVIAPILIISVLILSLVNAE